MEIENKMQEQEGEEEKKSVGKDDADIDIGFESPEEVGEAELADDSPRWWVIRTQAGIEEKVVNLIRDEAQNLGVADLIHEIFIPSEEIQIVRKRQTSTKKKNFFQGYILIKMVMNENTWHIIRALWRSFGRSAYFVGTRSQPRPIPDSEVERIKQRIQSGDIKRSLEVSRGDRVKIIFGPFKNFSGVVEDLSRDRSRARVLVTIFGRQTPVDIEVTQLEKLRST